MLVSCNGDLDWTPSVGSQPEKVFCLGDEAQKREDPVPVAYFSLMMLHCKSGFEKCVRLFNSVHGSSIHWDGNAGCRCLAGVITLVF